MQMTREEFYLRREARGLTVTFIGMSGIGKTHLAKQLGTLGFTLICADDLIAPRISRESPLRNVTDVGLWLGQPYSEGYGEREKLYLHVEEEVMGGILDGAEGNTVIDTTGSVIYLSDNVRRELKEKSLIAYFEATPEMYDHMLQHYLDDPKPVVWGDSFRQAKDEDREEALARSYPKLLEFRAKKYEELSDLTIPAGAVRESKAWNDPDLL